MRLFIIVLSVLTFLPPRPETRAQVLPFEYFTVVNGLLSNATMDLLLDSRGYLRIATGEGLSTFDGYTFTHLRTRDGLPSNFIYSVNELPSLPGVLWLCTTNGLARLDDFGIRTIQLDTTALSRLVYAVEEDGAGQIWCGTRDGLYTIRNGTIEKVPIPIVGSGIYTVLKSGPDSLIWVPVNNALLAFTPERTLVRHISLSASATNYVTAAYQDRSGRIWIGLRDGSLSAYEDGVLLRRQVLPSGRVRHILQDGLGQVYIGTDNGVLVTSFDRFQVGSFDHIGVENGLPGKVINAGLVDNEGDVWFAVSGFGIAKLTSTGLREFPIVGIPESYNNTRAACDSSGHFWIVSHNALVEVFKTSGGKWLQTRHVVGSSQEIPSGIIYDPSNRLWIIYPGGRIRSYAIVHRKDRASELQLRKPPTLGSFSFSPFMLIFDRKERVWWIDSLHLNVRESGITREYSLRDLVGETDVRTIYADSRGDIWLGGFSKGIAVIRGDSTDAMPLKMVPGKDIPSGFIRAFCEDVLGRIWVGTRYNGCMIIGKEGVTTVSSADFLPSDAVWTITRDRDGMMWVGTSAGIVAVDPRTLQPHSMGTRIVRDPVVASGVSPDGTIWYVTTAALGLIFPPYFSDGSPSLTVQLARMEVEGKPVDTRQPLAFSFDQTTFAFTFFASSFRDPQDIRYQYRLFDVESEWQQPTGERSVTYASLGPGRYRFEVRATRVGSSQYGEPAAIGFTIAPPWWDEVWFRVSAVVLVAALMIGVYRRRVGSLERERRIQREFSRQLMASQEAERKRIAGELHDSLGQDLLVIRNRALLGLKDGNVQGSARDQLDQISSIATQAINGVREISYGLRPYQLDRLGLRKAITSMTTGLATPVQFTMVVDVIDNVVRKDDAIHLFRIIQEGINNVLKHAEATEARVQVINNQNDILIVITDNGRGVRASVGHGRQGFGLLGIEERAKALNGSMKIESAAGKGTTLTVTIPKTVNT